MCVYTHKATGFWLRSCCDKIQLWPAAHTSLLLQIRYCILPGEDRGGHLEVTTLSTSWHSLQTGQTESTLLLSSLHWFTKSVGNHKDNNDYDIDHSRFIAVMVWEGQDLWDMKYFSNVQGLLYVLLQLL